MHYFFIKRKYNTLMAKTIIKTNKPEAWFNLEHVMNSYNIITEYFNLNSENFHLRINNSTTGDRD